jgi:quercetin dioxygenase-like cupin family protein
MNNKKRNVTGALTGLGVLALTAGLVQADQPVKTNYFSFATKVSAKQEDNIRDIRVVINGDQSDGRQSILESYWKPAFTVPPHFHKKHAETFLILSGHVEWTIGGETHVVGPGDAVYIPPNTVHSVKVVGTEDMHSIMIQEPGGYENITNYDASFTPEQKKDPKLMKQLNDLADFTPVEPAKAK